MTLLEPGPRLYTPAQVAVATALGSPVAGSFLMAINERRLGRTGRAFAAAGSGVSGTAALLVVGYYLRGPAANGLAVASIVAMHRIAVMTRDARGSQKPEPKASWWIAVAIGAFFFVAIVGSAILIAVAAGWIPN